MTGRAIDRRELAGLGLVLVLATACRFIGLAGRGIWDSDQGHDVLVFLDWIRNGTIPLLGPATSFGDFHHGAIYYYLLAPSAFLSGANPTAMVAEIALAGVAAVAVTWWLARSIGGPVAGFVAALVMAISASAISETTFVWNPNLIGLSSSIALAAAWRAHTTGRARWWPLAALGVLITMQCHVLGITLLPPVAGLWVQSIRSTPPGQSRKRLLWAGLAGVGILVVGHLPLLASELGHGFAGSRSIVAYLGQGGLGVSLSLPARLLFVALRILAWPLAGLLTSGLVIGVFAGMIVAAGIGWRAGQARGLERTAARWLGASLLFGWIVLTFGVARLSTVTPLPVDHYHSFLDPVVFVALGIGAAAVWRQGPLAIRAVMVAGIGTLLAWNVAIWPPAVSPDGGWPGARATGDRIEASLGNRAAAFVSLPDFKSADAYRSPIELDRAGSTAAATDAPGSTTGVIASGRLPADSGLVIVCDALFVRDCGGPAEDAYLGSARLLPTVAMRLADRWLASPYRTVSVYLPTP